jgi:hypothetical protein
MNILSIEQSTTPLKAEIFFSYKHIATEIPEHIYVLCVRVQHRAMSLVLRFGESFSLAMEKELKAILSEIDIFEKNGRMRESSLF